MEVMANHGIRTTRKTLVERLGDDGDETAWKEFYESYWEMINQWARRKGCSEQLAKDVFQETVVCLLRKLPDFEYKPDTGFFRSFLKTIVNRRVLDAYRKGARYVGEAALDDTDPGGRTRSFFEHCPAPEEQHESELDVVWLKSLLWKALRRAYARVDPRTYKAFCMYVLDGLPPKEVCAELGIEREGTLYQQKSRLIGIVQNEFFNLLSEIDEADLANFSSEETFKRVFDEIIRDKPDYRETLAQRSPPKKLLDRMDFVRRELKRHPAPTEEGAYLLVADARFVTPPRSGSAWIPLREELNIGRRDDCDLVVQSSRVSGLHAALFREIDQWKVRDERSTNGSYLNGKRIKEERLQSGDVIQLGEFLLLFLEIQPENM